MATSVTFGLIQNYVFPVKWQGKNERGESCVTSKKERSPQAFFSVPADYQKLDMGNMRMPGGTPPH